MPETAAEIEQKVPLSAPDTEKQTAPPARRNHWLGITKKEWLCFKVLFLFQYAAMGAFYPFCVVYYIARQLTPSQIGIMECTLPFMGAVTKPIIAQIADRFNLHKSCLGISILVYTAATFSLMFIRAPTDPVFPSYRVSLTCAESQVGQFFIESCDPKSILHNLTSYQVPGIHFSAIAKSRHSSFYRKCDKSGDSCQITCQGRLDGMFAGQRLDKTGFRAQVALPNGSNIFKEIGNVNASSLCQLYVGHLHESVTSLCKEKKEAKIENCQLDCYCSSKRTVIDPTSEYVDSMSILTPATTFGIILATRLIAAASYSPIFSLEDSIVYTTLGPENRPYWGQQKMFGQLAFGILAMIIGLLIDKWALNAAFIANAGLNLGAVAVTFFWIPQPENVACKRRTATGSALTEANKQLGCCGSLKKVCQSPMFIIAIFVAFFSGIFIGIFFVITPQWQLHLGGQGWLIGATAITGCFLQAIGFAFSGLVVRRFGEVICFLGTFLFFAIRYLSYSYLTPSTVWISIPLEITQIFCFSFYLSAMTNYADTVAPKGMSATIQAILQTSYFGFGTGIGILTSGAIYERIGGKLTFQIYALTAAVCFVVLLVIYLTFLRKRLYGSKQKQSDDETTKQQVEAAFFKEDNNENDL